MFSFPTHFAGTIVRKQDDTIIAAGKDDNPIDVLDLVRRGMSGEFRFISLDGTEQTFRFAPVGSSPSASSNGVGSMLQNMKLHYEAHAQMQRMRSEWQQEAASYEQRLRDLSRDLSETQQQHIREIDAIRREHERERAQWQTERQQLQSAIDLAEIKRELEIVKSGNISERLFDLIGEVAPKAFQFMETRLPKPSTTALPAHSGDGAPTEHIPSMTEHHTAQQDTASDPRLQAKIDAISSIARTISAAAQGEMNAMMGVADVMGQVRKLQADQLWHTFDIPVILHDALRSLLDAGIAPETAQQNLKSALQMGSGIIDVQHAEEQLASLFEQAGHAEHFTSDLREYVRAVIAAHLDGRETKAESE